MDAMTRATMMRATGRMIVRDARLRYIGMMIACTMALAPLPSRAQSSAPPAAAQSASPAHPTYPSVHADSAAHRLRPLDIDAYRQLIASSHGDTVVLIDFWATWCAPCKAEMPQLIALTRRRAARGVRLLTVSVDDSAEYDAAIRFLDSLGAPAPRYVKQPGQESAFIDAVDPQWSGALPALFLYDRAGRRVARFVGETPHATIEAAIDSLLAGNPAAGHR
jgi:thiol-disulfide isomerase/thioredoxin